MAGGHCISHRPGPDDVDLFVGGVEPDPRSSIETAMFIEEYKKRPQYPFEPEEAEQILAALGIHAGDYGMRDAKSLLEHWHGCIAGPLKADVDRTDGTDVAKDDLEVGSVVPGGEQK
jgi:hypothetical protein